MLRKMRKGEGDTMKKNRNAKLRIARILLAVIFALAAAVTAVYQFDNRNLTFIFVTDKGEQILKKSNLEIKQGKAAEFVFEQTNDIMIEEVRIYGQIKSMYLDKYRGGEFANYVESVQQGEKQPTETGVIYTGNGKVQLNMNEIFQKTCKDLSASFLIERLIMIEVLFILFSVGWIICKVIEEKSAEQSWDNHGPVLELKKFVKDITDYGQYMVYAAQTDLKAEVANSYLNRLWWLLEPFFNMIVYVIVFGQVMGNSIKNYATFIYSALLMWNLFNKTVNYSVKLVRNNKDIISKVYVPKFVLLLSNMILNIYKLLFSFIVLIAMMLIFKIQIGINTLLIFPAYFVMMLFAFGLGMIFLHFGVYVDDLSHAVVILLNMLMLLSGIFYDVMTTLPEPLNMIAMVLNPVAMLVNTMRNALIYNTVSNIPVLIIWGILSMLLCCVGVHIVYKNENSYVKVV